MNSFFIVDTAVGIETVVVIQSIFRCNIQILSHWYYFLQTCCKFSSFSDPERYQYITFSACPTHRKQFVDPTSAGKQWTVEWCPPRQHVGRPLSSAGMPLSRTGMPVCALAGKQTKPCPWREDTGLAGFPGPVLESTQFGCGPVVSSWTSGLFAKFGTGLMTFGCEGISENPS